MSASKTYFIPTGEKLQAYKHAFSKGYSVVITTEGRNTRIAIRKPAKKVKR